MQNVEKFLEKHRIRPADVNIQKLVELFTLEMQKGLEGKESTLRMIPTYIEADNEFMTEVPVVAIDAGGTNFRAARAEFTRNGSLELYDMVNAGMPGQEGEVSKDEFFRVIADRVRSHVAECDRIGFCFSYPTEIFPDKDGKLLQFCKEIKAPGVVGEMIGKNLLEALDASEKKIVLLNDTVATLLAGKSATIGRDYDSYIGFILGTGTNTCYIECNSNILKRKDLDLSKNQIINVESGNFGKAPRSDIDISFDNTTGNPGNYSFEKMFSGGYFGGLCLHTLKTAANEGVFSLSAASILSLEQLTTEDVNICLSNNSTNRGPLHGYIKNNSEQAICIRILENMVERAAVLVAANLSSVLLKTGRGMSPDRPVLITIEGTTFYKLHRLKPLFEEYFSGYLSGNNKRYFEFTEVPESSLAGAALAGLIS